MPQPFEDTWSTCASSRGVKLLKSTTCATRHTLKSVDLIGAYLFPKYAKFFAVPLLLHKCIYGLVFSRKYWNIEFLE
jgi:hypothetical protein